MVIFPMALVGFCVSQVKNGLISCGITSPEQVLSHHASMGRFRFFWPSNLIHLEDKGKKCTAYPAVKLNVVLAGATWLEPEPIHRCITDGNLVTGAAWPGHPEFVAQFMALLGLSVSF